MAGSGTWAMGMPSEQKCGSQVCLQQKPYKQGVLESAPVSPSDHVQSGGWPGANECLEILVLMMLLTTDCKSLSEVLMSWSTDGEH